MTSAKKRESLKIVPFDKKKCVWMEPGVVSYKLCDHNYDCSTCNYDHGMVAKIVKNKSDQSASVGKLNESWVEKMMALPAAQRKCRYMLTGEVGRKICPAAYECGTCSFDQMMQARLETDALPVHTPGKVAGFELAEGFYYHDGHTWARPEYGGRIRVGMDDFAGKLLGKKGRVELPKVGLMVSQGGVGFGITRNDQTVNVLAPVDGVVTHINKKLLDNPELLNESPYENGWLFTVEPSSLRKNLKTLHYGEDAHSFITAEREKLFGMVNDDMRVAADGGESIEDIFEEVEEKDWARFMQALS